MTTDLDERLRQYASRWNAAYDRAHPELPELPPAGRRHANRRRTLAVAASVVAVVVAAAGFAVFTPQHGRPSPAVNGTPRGPVPWSAVGVQPDATAVSAQAPVAAPDRLRDCANGDFSLSGSDTRLSTSNDGWLTTFFELRLVTSDSCAVPNGHVGAVLVTADGATLPDDIWPSQPIVLPSRLEVQPGQLVTGEATWAVYQGRAPRPTQLVIDPGQSTTPSALRVPLGSVAIPPHPRDPSNLGRWRSAAYARISTVSTPGTSASLRATVLAPENVDVGDLLRYEVMLSNDTTSSVSLADCPHFAQRIDVVSANVAAGKTLNTVGSSGPLNCADAPMLVAAGQSITFDFELSTGGEISGSGQLTWQLLAGNSAALTESAPLTLTP